MNSQKNEIPQNKLVWTWFGNGLGLGFSGPYRDAETFFNFLYAYGGTESEPIPVSQNFSYVLTSWKKLERGIQNGLLCEELHRVRSEPRQTRPDLWITAGIKTQAFLDILQPEEFLSMETETVIEPYQIAEEQEDE